MLQFDIVRSLSQGGMADLFLARARTLGYPVNLIDSEPDLVALRRDPLYQPPLPESAQ